MNSQMRPGSSPIESTPELRTALALKLKGFAEIDRLAEVAGMDEQTVHIVLTAAAARGDVAHRSGRIGGWHLTVRGRNWVEELIAEERNRIDAVDELERCYSGFLTLNADFKEFCTRWQLETAPLAALPEYADRLARYDEGVSDALLHGEAVLSRYGRYRGRFASARRRFANGDPEALTRPLSDSFHDVWMELHQDLLSTLGRTRSKADGH